MKEKQIHKGYFSIIPAFIRYDTKLKDKAKLLYAEITALSNENGYCYATNSYFSQIYGVAKETVSRLISELVNGGYVKVVLIKQNSEVVERRIYICEMSIPIDENVNTPIDENVKENSIYINNIPPYTPQRGDDVESDQLSVDNEPAEKKPSRLERDFEQFWAAYPKKIGKSLCLRKWKAIKPSAELVETMLTAIETQKQSDSWKKEQGQFIPNPHTWLNQGRWEDEVEKPTDYDPYEGYKVF